LVISTPAGRRSNIISGIASLLLVVRFAEDGLLALLEADLRPAITTAPGRGSARLASS
jgi:hypothetical protein